MSKRTFKDFVKQDVENIFVNQNEFAEIHNVGGVDMPVVIDNDLLQEKKLKNGGEGLSRCEVLFHAPASNFKSKPSVNKVMRFDNKIYNVFEVTENDGLYTITLERNRS